MSVQYKPDTMEIVDEIYIGALDESWLIDRFDCSDESDIDVYNSRMDNAAAQDADSTKETKKIGSFTYDVLSYVEDGTQKFMFVSALDTPIQFEGDAAIAAIYITAEANDASALTAIESVLETLKIG